MKTNRIVSLLALMLLSCGFAAAQAAPEALQKACGEILFIERDQYTPDHHNTATMFQVGEINESSFRGGSAMKAMNVKTGQVRTILDSPEGIIRDPELSFEGDRIIFAWRKDKNDYSHIYEVNTDGTGLRQFTFAKGITDIDPLYLPDGGIVFSSTREPKYCMCNRHIMCNLYRMDADGSNITQIGKSPLFEGHTALLPDGRLIYDRWEYVDRNFGDAQALWTVNPDGTKHSVYYGNNTASPGGVIDPRPLPESDLMLCIFSSCHDRPWGALALIDRKKGVDGIEPVIKTWPAEAYNAIKEEGWDMFDSYSGLPVKYEDPYPISQTQFLVSRSVEFDKDKNDLRMGIYLVEMDGGETLVAEGKQGLYDPMPIAPRFRPNVIPAARNHESKAGVFYVQNVYEGTHMQTVEPGTVKYLRIVESPEKRTWTAGDWNGQGVHCPGMNWTNFENKRILGEVPVYEDGSAHFEVPANTFVYFQLLDADKKMVHSMRSGTMVLPGETNGCVGCHENRLSVPVPMGKMPQALRKKPAKMNGWMGEPARLFSYTELIQPIWDKHCVSCHDFDIENREKTILAGDKNPYFNASFIELHAKKIVNVIGAGPPTFQLPYSWGSHASKLTKFLESTHNDVKLTPEEKLTVWTWLDVNGVYYPVYESAYPDSPSGRSPLDAAELRRLSELTGMDFLGHLKGHGRGVGPQISFERPELSPCLDKIRDDKAKYDEAVAIIALAAPRLAEKPRGDMPGFVPCDTHLEQLRKYAARLEQERASSQAITKGGKNADK